MGKLIASLGALLLSGYFGAASAGGDVRQEPLSASEPLGEEGHARADLAEVAALPATFDSTASMLTGEMSDQEKERRREVCRKIHDQRYDQCTRWYAEKYPKKLQPCYVRCADDLAECMKEIPN